MTSRGRVLVLDGESGESALAVVRSLGRRGYEVELGFSEGAPRRAAVSRYVARARIYPEATHATERFHETLLRWAPTVGAVIPIKEPTLLATASIRSELESAGARVPIADHDTLRTATDKVAMLELARRAGLRVPRSRIVASLEAARGASGELGVPVVMKSSTEIGLLPVERHFLVSDLASPTFVTEFDRLSRFGPVVLQEYIVGQGAGIALLYNRRSELLAYSGHRRRFEQISDGGPSVLARTDVHAEALVQSRRLLESLPWQGLALVEFRIDGAGRPVYMEVNPRVWGTLPLAVDSGVDFPSLLLERFDGPAPPVPLGPRRRRGYLSLEALITSRGAPREKRPRLSRFLLELARSSRGLSVREFQGHDPAPMVEEFFHVLRARATQGRVARVDRLLFGPPVDYADLYRRGVRTVVDLREPREVGSRPLPVPPGLTRRAFPIVDDTGVPPERFRELIETLSRALREGGVYVHCRQGKGRAPMTAVGWLVSNGVGLEEAFDQVYRARPFSYLNAVQRNSVVELAGSLRPD